MFRAIYLLLRLAKYSDTPQHVGHRRKPNSAVGQVSDLSTITPCGAGHRPASATKPPRTDRFHHLLWLTRPWRQVVNLRAGWLPALCKPRPMSSGGGLATRRRLTTCPTSRPIRQLILRASIILLSVPACEASTAADIARQIQITGLDPEECYRVIEQDFTRED